MLLIFVSVRYGNVSYLREILSNFKFILEFSIVKCKIYEIEGKTVMNDFQITDGGCRVCRHL
jgi:hypothetical protein